MPDLVVPSLTNLCDFADARARGKTGHVGQDRRRAAAPTDGRFPSFYYEKFLTSCIEFVGAGRRGSAFERLIESAETSRAANYQAAATGAVKIFGNLQPIAARRGKKVDVVDSEGALLVRAKFHLVLTLPDATELWCFAHFREGRLGGTSTELISTVLGIAAMRQPLLFVPSPAIALVRSGEVEEIDARSAASPENIDRIAREVDLYRDAWANAA
jgi:hypothetical protein